MDSQKRKQLREEYKNRRPEMGIISFRCKETNQTFLGISTDTKADFNSNMVRLKYNVHPNKTLQKLWNQYGSDGFELSVVARLKYDNPQDDHRKKLEALREECFQQCPQATKIWL